MVYILLNDKLHVQLILHALCLAGSVSIRATVGARRKINHHWLMRSPFLVCIPAILTNHARCTSPSHQVQ